MNAYRHQVMQCHSLLKAKENYSLNVAASDYCGTTYAVALGQD